MTTEAQLDLKAKIDHVTYALNGYIDMLKEYGLQAHVSLSDNEKGTGVEIKVKLSIPI